MDVAQAIRMSMSIPLFFEPVRLGEHLIVDGGLLSNFPASLFDNTETIGFRLRANADEIKFASEGLRGMLPAMLGAMLDARDKYDLEIRELEGLIEIDPGQVSTTQFALESKQKEALFQSGISAASRFFLDEKNRNRARQLSANGRPDQIAIDLSSLPAASLKDDTEVRFSISGLVRIEYGGRYMLVKGARIDQFQPVGGVFKALPSAMPELRRLGMKSDSKFPIDADSVGDLRVMLPLRSCTKFLQWYLEGRGRETSPWREFYEELIEPGHLSASHFMSAAFDHIGRKVKGIHFSEHFQCYEILIAELFALSPTAKQEVELDCAMQRGNRPEIIWASPSLIRSRGFDLASQKQIQTISETSSWLLEDD